MRPHTHLLTRYVTLFTFGLLLGVGGTAIAAAMLGSSVFSDVRTGTFYDEAVGELHNLGIIRGYEDGRFGPNDYVTRGQVVVLMKRLRDELMGEELAGSQTPSSPLAASVIGGSSSDSSSSSSASSSSSSVQSSQANLAGLIRFTIASYHANEDGGAATVSVVRTGGKKGAVTVEYALSDGTATAGIDYEIVSGTLRFADGETSKTFSVTILDDSIQEGNETITLTLSEPGGGAALTTPSTAVLTIADDDSASSSASAADAFSFSALSYDVAEDGGIISITVTRTAGSQGTATVRYATSNGTASSIHYVSTNGTLAFSAGETAKAFTVDMHDNGIINGNKTVNLTLRDPTGGAVLGGTSAAKLTIVDDEVGTFGSGSFKFTRAMFEGLESDGEAVIEISRVGGAKGTASVDYATSGGTAVAGIDYTAVSGTLTFLPGESKKFFAVPLVDDDQNDSGEKVNLTLTNPTGGTVLTSPTSATLEIQ